MDTNRIPKQALQYKRKGRRNIGRPRKRWRDQLHLEDQGTGNTPNLSGTWWWSWIFLGKRCITFCKGERHHIPHMVKIVLYREWIFSLWILWHLNTGWLYRTKGSTWLWADETKHFENKHVTRWQSSLLAMQITCWFTYKRNGIDSIRWSGMKIP